MFQLFEKLAQLCDGEFFDINTSYQAVHFVTNAKQAFSFEHGMLHNFGFHGFEKR